MKNLSILLVLSVGLECCGHNPVAPLDKSPREYTWDVSTISYPNSASVAMQSIWASSPNDVYLCGLNSRGPLMFHFDGRKWSALVTLPNVASHLWDVKGFAQNDIWVAGETSFYSQDQQIYVDSASILHFDGIAWKESLTSRAGVRGIISLWGTSSEDMFFGSLDGKALHYDGAKWTLDTLYLGLAVDGIGGDESRVFAAGNTWKGGADTAMSMVRTGSKWAVIDMQPWSQFSLVPNFGLRFYAPEKGLYYSCAKSGIFRWDNDRWSSVFIDAYSAIVRLGGSGSNNIFAVGWSGVHQGPIMYHWNGTEWAEIGLSDETRQLLKSVEFYDVWTDGKQAFIVGNNGAVTYILHGQ